MLDLNYQPDDPGCQPRKENAMFTGFKTVVAGLGLAVLPTALNYVAGVDWSFLGAKGAFLVSAAIMVAMRAMTTTPIFKK